MKIIKAAAAVVGIVSAAVVLYTADAAIGAIRWVKEQL